MTLRVACIGEAMIELRPRGAVADLGVAGDTLNTAIYLKRSAPALHVDYITRLGTDALSDRIVQAIAAEGIGTQRIARDPAGTPGLYAITLSAQGERSFLYWRDRSAARALFADGEPPDLADYDLIYLSGITVAIITPQARQALLDAVTDSPARFAFDTNYRPALWPARQEAQTVCAAFLAQAEIPLPSLEDEMALSGEDEAQVVARMTALPGMGALKRGARGPLSLGAPVEQDYASAPRIVDSTAAGDSFNGAYLAARLTGQSQAEALRTGHDMASCVVQHRGAIIPPG